MKKIYIYELIRKLIFMLIIFILLAFTVFKMIRPTKSTIKNVEDIKKISSVDGKIIGLAELNNATIVFIDHNNDLKTILYKREKEGYQEDIKTEQPDFFSDKMNFIDKDIFEATLKNMQKQSDRVQQENKFTSFYTMNPKEKSLKINEKEATQILSYKKNGTTFFFLLFDDIDYTKPMKVTL